MVVEKMLNHIREVLENMPKDWLNLTTHRLDIYKEDQAKVEFLERFEDLGNEGKADVKTLSELPTAFDYIRLGHPLSCILEYTIAELNNIPAAQVISFSSKITPVLAVLRKNLLDKKSTRILYQNESTIAKHAEIIKKVYGYDFELQHLEDGDAIEAFEGSTIFISNKDQTIQKDSNVDFQVQLHGDLGSIIIVTSEENAHYVPEIQHVRRRETIAMTPINCLAALKTLVNKSEVQAATSNREEDKAKVINSIKEITGTTIEPLIGSSGLSIQYAIMMGLIHDAFENHPGKEIKFVVPPNCYGGTNDQARRVAACIDQVEVVDFPVDGDHEMVKSLNSVLAKIADEDAVPYIIAEIPTNPRVEVPDLDKLKNVLSQERKTSTGNKAVDPVFILDQTFCPNVHFLGEGKILSTVRTISYASGSKFPSGGLCTAGYCVGNLITESLMKKVDLHLNLCDNEATILQMEILAKQLPSMLERIQSAYNNTRAFVNFIERTLPEAKINFVSEELAAQGFTPSVFSLDLPTKGNTPEEKEDFKRKLNHKLINLMITKIPNESKYCVSYGQLKGCYWTIPATSTQGTTKEGDKDYIARVAMSGNMDLALHKEVFQEFVDMI